jgi:hypothetical protein
MAQLTPPPDILPIVQLSPRIDMKEYQSLSGGSVLLPNSSNSSNHVLHPAEQVDHFLKYGFIVIKNAFSREKAAQFTETMWIRLGLDPNDKSTWTRERIHMPWHNREEVATFAPKVVPALEYLIEYLF